jgi:putative chitinase
MKTITKLAIAGAVGVLLLSRSAKAAPGGPMGPLTDEALRRIDSRVRKDFAGALAPAMEAGGITTVARAAAFLGQILHETGGFQFMVELASGDAYEGRADLGNTQPGDGRRFKGRGFIQLTGRANYAAAGRELGLPLEAQPELAAQPGIAARTAVWFWTRKGLNARADAGDVVGITRAINGGTNGLAERQRLTDRALAVLGERPVA